ncbi:MAG: hypothetical protein IKW74_02575, partial [Thermoguttaceae bacterium]|nr:hypothetical protein [Thermoguttaceae bacterium]
TLVIVTADHNTGRMFGPGTYDDVNGDGKFKEKDGDSFNDFMPIKNAGQSVVPEVQYSTNGHSNMLVPIWIKGVGADDVDSLIRGHDDKAAQFYNFSGDYIDNTDVFTLMMKASGFEKK